MANRPSQIKYYLTNTNLTETLDVVDLTIDYVYDLFVNNIIFEPQNDMDMYYLGIYYYTKRNYKEMKKYFLMAIGKGNSYAMVDLGYYYYNDKSRPIQMTTYYSMALNKGDHRAMRNFGRYYRWKHNYDEMLKYFLMAIEKGDVISMNYLACHYSTMKNYELELKYFLMAIDLGNTNSMRNLARSYFMKGDYINMIKYYHIAIDLGNCNAMMDMGKYHKKIKNYKMMEMYYLMGIQGGHQPCYGDLAKYYGDNYLLKNLGLYVNYNHIFINKGNAISTICLISFPLEAIQAKKHEILQLLHDGDCNDDVINIILERLKLKN